MSICTFSYLESIPLCIMQNRRSGAVSTNVSLSKCKTTQCLAKLGYISGSYSLYFLTNLRGCSTFLLPCTATKHLWARNAERNNYFIFTYKPCTAEHWNCQNTITDRQSNWELRPVSNDMFCGILGKSHFFSQVSIDTWCIFRVFGKQLGLRQVAVDKLLFDPVFNLSSQDNNDYSSE